MRPDVTIIVPIFGNINRWGRRAERAMASAVAQTQPAAKIILSEAATLSAARNVPASEATTDWLCFLDADDELDVRYVEKMLQGDGDVRKPATLGIVDGVADDRAVVIPEQPLGRANHIVIGAFVRRDLFAEVGGFRELAAFEDWDLWLRCWLAGADIGTCPEAIYRVHVTPGGRNAMTQDQLADAYHQVRRTYLGQHRRDRS